jgi:aldose 1-epimerase
MEIKHISYLTENYNEKFLGFAPNGEAVSSYTLKNQNGMELQLMNYGATVMSLKINLKSGKNTDVVLGFDTLKNYIDSYGLKSAPYFGATIGRYAGRIANGNFELDGENFQLNKNSGENSLHGGDIGFSQMVWKVRRINFYKNPSIVLMHSSAHNEENFPGNLNVEIQYTLSEKNEFIVEYKATTDKDTIINLTHHSYFNLNGHNSDIRDQLLFVNSRRILETTPENIPTGKFLNLSHCPFDFTAPKNCPEKIDTTFIIDKQTPIAASLFSFKNKLKMEVFTNQPGVHVYVGGNCFNQLSGKENTDYHPLSGICFETQNFPDAPNHAHFPSALLKKGETYHHKTIYHFQSF